MIHIVITSFALLTPPVFQYIDYNGDHSEVKKHSAASFLRTSYQLLTVS